MDTDSTDDTRLLLLIRHGLPDYRGAQPGDEPPGPPLSEVGRMQVLQAIPVLRRHAPERIWVSPLARATDTAAVIARELNLACGVDAELREWHRTERLHDVSVRATRWLLRWLRGPERCAAVVSHASPLLAIMRSALYLPHVAWHRTGSPDALELSSCDRFEVSMASVFALRIGPRYVVATFAFRPHPPMYHCTPTASHPRAPYPVPGCGPNLRIQRPNRLDLLGFRGERPRAGRYGGLLH